MERAKEGYFEHTLVMCHSVLTIYWAPFVPGFSVYFLRDDEQQCLHTRRPMK